MPVSILRYDDFPLFRIRLFYLRSLNLLFLHMNQLRNLPRNIRIPARQHHTVNWITGIPDICSVTILLCCPVFSSRLIIPISVYNNICWYCINITTVFIIDLQSRSFGVFRLLRLNQTVGKFDSSGLFKLGNSSSWRLLNLNTCHRVWIVLRTQSDGILHKFADYDPTAAKRACDRISICILCRNGSTKFGSSLRRNCDPYAFSLSDSGFLPKFCQRISFNWFVRCHLESLKFLFRICFQGNKLPDLPGSFPIIPARRKYTVYRLIPGKPDIRGSVRVSSHSPPVGSFVLLSPVPVVVDNDLALDIFNGCAIAALIVKL